MTLQERLCEYATRRLFGVLEPAEFSLPWTYVHSRWVDSDGTPHHECSGVRIERLDGTSLTVTVAQMQAGSAAKKWGANA